MSRDDKEYYEDLSQKFYEMILALDKWLEIRQDGRDCIGYFDHFGYKSVAIYGTSFLAKRLQDELKGTDISVDCIFDRDSIDTIRESNADIIVITSMYYYYEIVEDLKKITDIPMISISSIISSS